MYGRFISAKTNKKGIGWRFSFGTTGIYRYSLALLRVQTNSFGVWAIAALVVITLLRVFRRLAACTYGSTTAETSLILFSSSLGLLGANAPLTCRYGCSPGCWRTNFTGVLLKFIK